MLTLKDLYKIGNGPSSSHTMGPQKASAIFKEKYADADEFKVVLFGSLSETGKGHMTDYIILETFKPYKCEVEFSTEDIELPHPNTMELYAYKNSEEIAHWKVMSVGGGAIQIEGEKVEVLPDIYPHNSFDEIKEYCEKNNMELWEYALKYEDNDFMEYLDDIWTTMKECIKNGLSTEGVLKGGLGVQRKGKYLYNQRHMDELPETRENRLVCSYAFAVSEENADCGKIVTAPTCGSCGIMPAVLKYMQDKKGFSDYEIKKALATGGIIGNLVKTNASISGAECGCQAEVGTACCMAAAALAQLFGMSINQIEYAAEVAMEHHLGLTCDPICGLVQIPCIERNAVAAMRAINATNLANFLTDSRKISFDMVVETMYQTGVDLHKKYRETAQGGLAKLYPQIEK